MGWQAENYLTGPRVSKNALGRYPHPLLPCR